MHHQFYAFYYGHRNISNNAGQACQQCVESAGVHFIVKFASNFDNNYYNKSQQVYLRAGASNPPLWMGDQPPHLTR